MGEMSTQRFARYGYLPFALFLCPLAGVVSWVIASVLADRDRSGATTVICFVAIPALLAYLAGRATPRSAREIVVVSIGAGLMGAATFAGLIFLVASSGGLD